MQYQYNYQSSSPLASMLSLIIGLAFYAYIAYSFMVIAQKTNTDNGWFVWVPILNFVLIINIAKKPIWWILLLFIPLVNVVIMILLYMQIAEMRNKPSWVGLLILVPFVNFVIPGYLAFSD